jgi:hypothetical protein
VKYTYSAEVFKPAYASLAEVARMVDKYLQAAISTSGLSGLDVELRYVPIVMPTNMHGRYSERSKLRKSQRLYDCAPTLNYDFFVSGSKEAQLNEYIRGIRLSSPFLAQLGASGEQVREFEEILNSVNFQTINANIDQVRH